MDKSLSLAVFTEASRKIGTGHLIESINLVNLARRKGINSRLWVSCSSPKALLDRIPFSFSLFSCSNEVVKVLRSNRFNTALFNFRRIDNSLLRSLPKDLKIICIDELGGRRLDCGVIINPMIAGKYLRYPAFCRKTRIYVGAKYLCLSLNFIQARRRKGEFKGAIKEVSICMGGVDRSAATLNIINTLIKWRKEVRKNIILGGDFPFVSKIRKMQGELKKLNFKIYHNVKNVVPLFLNSDIVFTAGGNTLYELACVGTPAVVLYEDKHEKENGLAFKRCGFGICLGRGASVKKKKILSALSKLDNAAYRRRQSSKGKAIVDGKGTERILEIIKGMSR